MDPADPGSAGRRRHGRRGVSAFLDPDLGDEAEGEDEPVDWSILGGNLDECTAGDP